MSSRMPELSIEDLAPEALALLRHHNLLSALIKAEVVAEAVGGVALSEEQCDQLWNGYLSNHKIENDEQLASHLQARGLDAEALHWQLELPARVQQHSWAQFQHKAEARFLAKKEQLDSVVYSLLRVRDAWHGSSLQSWPGAAAWRERSQGREQTRHRGPCPEPCPSGPEQGCAPASLANCWNASNQTGGSGPADATGAL